jgi:hypothetical protein
MRRVAGREGGPVAQTLAQAEFKPYVADHETPTELTLRALLVGSFLGLIFGASSVYLALRVASPSPRPCPSR